MFDNFIELCIEHKVKQELQENTETVGGQSTDRNSTMWQLNSFLV